MGSRTEWLLQFFDCEHLPADIAAHMRPFRELAIRIVEMVHENPERTTALRKLLEAHDCTLRALVGKWPERAD